MTRAGDVLLRAPKTSFKTTAVTARNMCQWIAGLPFKSGSTGHGRLSLAAQGHPHVFYWAVCVRPPAVF